MRPREIARTTVQPNETELVLALDPELLWFRGHFAIQPLLPGVAQLDWVMHYAITLLAPGFRFLSIQNVKFQSPLLPGNIVTLVIRWFPEKQILTFSYHRHEGDERHAASSGKIKLCR